MLIERNILTEILSMIYDIDLSCQSKISKISFFIYYAIGKHEEKQDEHGFVSRHFTRKYLLPSNYKPDAVQSTLSSDGILTVTATAPEILPQQNQERSVPITHVGPSRQENQSVSQDQQPKIEQVN
jgi:crystallin alpha B